MNPTSVQMSFYGYTQGASAVASASTADDNSVATSDSGGVNRQYVQRCLFNWRRQLGIDLSVEEHAVFRQNKKYYMKVEELDPRLLCKMIYHFHPSFQFPSNPIPIPTPSINISETSIVETPPQI
jgi:hypothetical protein